MYNFSLFREKTGLLIVDVQERLFPLVERPCEVMHALQTVIKGFQILKLPIFVTEQYPKGLGSTIDGLKHFLGSDQEYHSKTAFSCMNDEMISQRILESSITQWVIAGIEAHVCVLQTVKGLLRADHQVVVLNDAISSRSIFDYSTAIAEMRDCGSRVSSVETILFELLADSRVAEFKEISTLLR